ncbi:MAG: PilW family protein [Legionella sp.]
MNNVNSQGFSIVEFMVAIALGLIINYAVLQVYLAQTQIYKTTNSQNVTLNVETAISQLITPIIRSAGYLGCGSMNTAISNLINGGPPPLGLFGNTTTMIYGYSGSSSSITISRVNDSNSNNASDWLPNLDTSLVGQVQKGSDVLVVFGAAPPSQPITITSIADGSNTFTLLNPIDVGSVGAFGAVSDCAKSIIFNITSNANKNIGHNSGSTPMQNATTEFPVNFQNGAQFIPVQQNAFFIGYSQGDQSALMQGSYNGKTWDIQPLVPGIEVMKVLYGIGDNKGITQYVTANNVKNWSQVYAVRIGFLIAGEQGSGDFNKTSYTVLDTMVNTPKDGRLRYVYEITADLRNA